MRKILESNELSLKLKLQLYKLVVCSIMTYGNEDWTLDKPVCKALNNVNDVMISVFSGENIREESISVRVTFDILSWIRARRL